MRVAGLLLAAGAGRRYGSPKALVVERGQSWLARSVRALAEGGCTDVSVVLGADADAARELMADQDLMGWVNVIVAEDWREGMSASLRSGLTALHGTQASAVVVTLVDLLDVGPEVVARLGGRFDETTLRRASYDGKPGHPVVLGRDHWAAIIDTASGDVGARDYLAMHAVEVVECGDLATGTDQDRPQGQPGANRT